MVASEKARRARKQEETDILTKKGERLREINI
jgi:hypothetical protein